jgi:tetrahydromethanopterin S-methyltransferase subunit B
MNQVDEIKANAREIRQGLKKLGADRVIALSVHKSKELIAELEQKADQLLKQLDAG